MIYADGFHALMANGNDDGLRDASQYGAGYTFDNGRVGEQSGDGGTTRNMASTQHLGTGGLGMSDGVSANGNGAGSHASQPQLVYPALHLQPLNDTFAPKQINLAPPGPNNKIKIGRQTNAKSAPAPNNGYFDSKVLSRMHAEVWAQDGKVYIKDVKSSNGTFINNTRLSQEGQESEVFELHNDDLVEFGIDIVGDDNKTIVHHKVACRVFLVITAEEALGLRHDFAVLYRGGIAGSTLNHHLVGPGAEGGLRRAKPVSGQNGVNGFISFDYVIHRLQAELQKSRETASNLNTLNTSMSDISETLNGGMPPLHNPSYQHMVPPLNGEGGDRQSAAKREAFDTAEKERLAEIKALEEQVKETQDTLHAHVERLMGLESRFEEHDSMRSSVAVITKQIEDARRDLAEATRQRDSALTNANIDRHTAEGASRDGAANGLAANGDEDFEDGTSMLSVDTITMDDTNRSNVGQGPVGVDEVESADVVGHMSLQDVQDEDDEQEAAARLRRHVGPLAPADGPDQALDRARTDDDQSRRNEELSKRLEAMESQLERALDLGRTLAGQHAESAETVKRLEDRIKSLESEHQRLDTTTVELKESVEKSALSGANSGDRDAAGTASNLAEGAAGGVAAGGILALLESKWGSWREAFEAEHKKDKATMLSERDEMRRIVLAWDSLNQDLEDAMDGAAPSSSSSAAGDERGKSTAGPSRERAPSAPGARRRKKKSKQGNASASSGLEASTTETASSSSLIPDNSTVRLNRDLRALLYTNDFNLLVRDEHISPPHVSNASSTLRGKSPDNGNFTGTTSASQAASATTSPEQGSVPLDDLNSEAGDKSSGSAGFRAGAALGRELTPEEMREGVRKRVLMNTAHRRRKGRAAHGFDNAASLPVLGAAGVLVVGMTAWIMAGKGVNLGSGSGGGWN